MVESISELHGKLVTGPTKTGARRTVSIPASLAAVLEAHLAEYPSSSGYVFTSAEGGPLRHRNFYRRHFRPAVKTAGLPETLRFHDLHHTCVALLIEQGARPKAIQERLGHSTIRLTFDRYGHLFPSLDERLAEGLDQMFREASAASSRPERPATSSGTPRGPRRGL